MPSQFPECLNYLLTKQNKRASTRSKRLRLESAALQRRFEDSADTFRHEKEADKISSTNDLYAHIKAKKSHFWKVFKGNGSLILVDIVENEAPFAKYSVVVNGGLSVTVNLLNAPVSSLASYLLVPAAVKNRREIAELL